MGRYYNGDIQGKFWFGVQPSNDADFFGVIGNRPERLEYYFEADDKPKVNKGINICRKELSKSNTDLYWKKTIDEFFKTNNGYNDDMMAKALGITKTKLSYLLEIYARLELGLQIRKCLKNHGSCEFEAEL